MKILVIGAGIGGLSFACLAKRSGHDVRLIEKCSESTAGGYILGLWANGDQVLRELVETEQLDKASFRGKDQVLHSFSGKELSRIDIESLKSKTPIVRFINRTVLCELLRGAQETPSVEYNRWVTNIEAQSPSPLIHFDDETTEHFDLIVGADGVHSTTRELLFEHQGCTTYPAVQWAFCLPIKSLLTGSMEFIGKGRLLGIYQGVDEIGVYAIANDSFTRGSFEHPGEELKQIFSDFPPFTQGVLKQLTPNTSIHRGKPREVAINSWTSRSTVLIGDAAHATLVTSGQGASQSLLDAYWLNHFLANTPNLDTALKNFELERAPTVTQAQKRAHFNLKLILSQNPIIEYARDLACRIMPDRIRLREFKALLSDGKICSA